MGCVEVGIVRNRWTYVKQIPDLKVITNRAAAPWSVSGFGRANGGRTGPRLAVGVLVALGERDAAERRAGQLQTMIDREQLSRRQAESPGSATPARVEAEHPSQECTEARLYEISGL
jgi:hypothetical protein